MKPRSAQGTMQHSRSDRLSRVVKAGVQAAALSCAAIAPAKAETVVLWPVKDATLFANDTGALASGSGPAFFVGNNSQLNTRRAVLGFDISSAIPAGAQIDRVVLRLVLSSTPDSTSTRAVTLHRLQAEWGEGSSYSTGGGGAPASAGDVTWIHRFYPDSPWQSPGGDFDVDARATTSVGAVGVYSFTSDAMTADVQHWLDQPQFAFGWLLRGEEGEAGTARRFDSRESPVVANRPVLVVTYTTTLGLVPCNWSRIKVRYAQ